MSELLNTNFMLGDWVYHPEYTDNRPAKIVRLNDRESSGFEPIPLTSAILERNGWHYNDWESKFAPNTWSGGGLTLRGADDSGYMIVVTSDYDDEDTNSTPFVLRFVHELQHALRLRRIENPIEL